MKYLLASMLMMSLCAPAFANERDEEREVRFRCEFQDPSFAAGKKTGANQCWVRGRAELEDQDDHHEEALGRNRRDRRDREGALEIRCSDGFQFFSRNVAATENRDDIQIASERRDEKLVYLLIQDIIRHRHHDGDRFRDRDRDVAAADLMYSPSPLVAKRLVGRCWVDVEREHHHDHDGNGPGIPGNGPGPMPTNGPTPPAAQ